MSRVIVGLLAGFTGFAAVAQPRPVLLLGDSLSAAYGIAREASWPELMRERLAALEPPRALVNASISGETSAGGASRLPALLDEHAPALLLLELGGNDGLRGLPPARLRDNLQAMARATAEQGGCTLLFAMRIPSNYGPRYTQAFDAVYTELAQAEDSVALLPFFLAEIATDPQWFLEDGIHPNEQAQPLLLQAVWPRVAQAIEAQQCVDGRWLAPAEVDSEAS